MILFSYPDSFSLRSLWPKSARPGLLLLQLSTHTVDKKDQEESYISDMVATGAARVNSENQGYSSSLAEQKHTYPGITLKMEYTSKSSGKCLKICKFTVHRKLNTDIPEICLNLTHERNDI